MFVATLEGTPAGLATATIDASPPGPAGSVLALDLLYVAPPMRRNGLGRALAEAVLAWGAQRGCARIDAPALPGDRPTKSLFESLGLRARLLLLSAPLTDEPG